MLSTKEVLETQRGISSASLDTLRSVYLNLTLQELKAITNKFGNTFNDKKKFKNIIFDKYSNSTKLNLLSLPYSVISKTFHYLDTHQRYKISTVCFEIFKISQNPNSNYKKFLTFSNNLFCQLDLTSKQFTC